MKILIDANIALDVLLERRPFYISGVRVLGLSKSGIELFISASTVTDIYYITRKELKNKEAALTLLKNLLTSVDVAAVTESEIYRAMVRCPLLHYLVICILSKINTKTYGSIKNKIFNGYLIFFKIIFNIM